MPFNIIAHKSRTEKFTLPLLEEDGVTGVTIAVTDVVRFKIALYESGTPLLDLDSAAPSANGSSVTIQALANPASAEVCLDQDDMALLPARSLYAEYALVDDSDSDRIFVIDRGTVEVQGSQGGDVGLT